MDFDEQLRDFPSTVHKVIYTAARGLAPLERSLAAVGGDMRASCEAYYAFLMMMFSDMYQHPEAYGMPVMELERHCGRRTVNGMKQLAPNKTQTILALTRNSVNGYVMLLHAMGRRGVLSGDKLTLTDSDLAAIDKLVNTSVRPIPVMERLAAMERVGLIMRDNVVTSVNHPAMFSAMCALAARAEKTSGFDFFAFRRADFRNLAGKFKPGYDDYFLPLYDDRRELAYELHRFAAERKLKPVVSTFWKVEYKYKGAQVMCIGSEGDHESLLDVRVVGTYGWDDPALINDRLAKETPEFQRYIMRHILRCTGCATTHLGGYVTVLGKRQRVCGGGMIGFRWMNPGADDLEAIKRMIELRCEILDVLPKRK